DYANNKLTFGTGTRLQIIS
uniref:Uncharacterized protein n=1 Tax=Sarcophilus harrisii TaxID=9305 RepID=A0A7N4V2P5_SARHA